VSQSTETLKNDIAFAADMAREGAKPTYAGGEFLLFCGALFGGASFAVAASLAGYLPIDMTWLWLGSMVIFAIGLPILIVRSRRSNGYRMIGDRAVGQAWTAIGWAIFVIAGSISIVSYQLHTETPIWLFAPIILALYGVGWSISATLSERTFAKVMTVGAFVSAVVVASLVKWPALMFAAYGLALILLAAAPGVIWMRIRKQAQA
jgi:hypothetical protein